MSSAAVQNLVQNATKQPSDDKSSFSFYKCFLYMCFFNLLYVPNLVCNVNMKKVFKIIANHGSGQKLYSVSLMYVMCSIVAIGSPFLTFLEYATSKIGVGLRWTFRIFSCPFPLNRTYLEWLSDRSIWCLHFYTWQLLHTVNFLDQFIFTHTLYIDDI